MIDQHYFSPVGVLDFLLYPTYLLTRRWLRLSQSVGMARYRYRLGCMLCLSLFVATNRVFSFPLVFRSPTVVSFSSSVMRIQMSQKEETATTTTTTTTADASAPVVQEEEGDVMFGKFVIPATHVFYRSPPTPSSSSSSSYAFVNLRPLVPGHVLVIPHDNNVPHLSDLTQEAYLDLWKTVRVVQTVLQRQYPDTTAFHVAVQDGRAAGQSVPHVHVHILPRQPGDYYNHHHDDQKNIYTDLDEWAPRDEMRVQKQKLSVPNEEDRRDRTTREMADEAALYRKIVQDMVGLM